jgi:hypothetical protein
VQLEAEESRLLRLCPAWQHRSSTCGRALLPHADKLMFVYVLELCKSEAKRAAYECFSYFGEVSFFVVSNVSTRNRVLCKMKEQLLKRFKC